MRAKETTWQNVRLTTYIGTYVRTYVRMYVRTYVHTYVRFEKIRVDLAEQLGMEEEDDEEIEEQELSESEGTDHSMAELAQQPPQAPALVSQKPRWA